MQAARTSAARLARPLRQPIQRRLESSSSSHAEHQSTAHPTEQNETFGSRFFIILAALPLGWVAYDATTSDAEHPPAFTRYIASYDGWQKEFVRRNDEHARLVQQAAYDRNLFGTAEATQMVDLRFPEQFNTGSPFNNVAGHRADLRELVAHYEKRNKEMTEKVANKTPEQRRLS